MWENVNDTSRHTIFEEYHIPSDQLYFQGKADLSYIVNAWRKLDIKKYPRMKSIRKTILSEWEKRPELHGMHDTPEVFRQHLDFIEMVISKSTPSIK